MLIYVTVLTLSGWRQNVDKFATMVPTNSYWKLRLHGLGAPESEVPVSGGRYGAVVAILPAEYLINLIEFNTTVLWTLFGKIADWRQEEEITVVVIHAQFLHLSLLAARAANAPAVEALMQVKGRMEVLRNAYRTAVGSPEAPFYPEYFEFIQVWRLNALKYLDDTD